MLSRRTLLQQIGLTSLACGAPMLSFARAETDARFVLVVLRGAVDGLALAPPYGEGNYRKLRGELAIGSPGGSEGVLNWTAFSACIRLFGIQNDFTMKAKHSLSMRRQARIVNARISTARISWKMVPVPVACTVTGG